MKHGRTDNNQNDIVQALRQAYCCVFDSSDVGGGFPDLVVFRPSTRVLKLLEVKSAKGKATRQQVEFHYLFPVTIVRTVKDALEAMGIAADSV